DEQVRIHRFIRGLNLDLGGKVCIHYLHTLEQAVEKDDIAEETRGKTRKLEIEYRDESIRYRITGQAGQLLLVKDMVLY
ncbi:hypothetical protein KI387_001179, partial [Taxus chinensis]